MTSDSFVMMENIRKVYPDGVQALQGITIDFRQGEVHGLLGENGAGKSTLMRILFGQIKQSSGIVYVKGSQVDFQSPRDAIAKGIGMVFQHFMLVTNFTGMENLMLGLDLRERKGGPKTLRTEVLDLANSLGLKVDLDALVSDMPMGERQRIEILKLLVRNVELLILDEPTSALTPFETEELLKAMRKLRTEGKAIVFVTHKLREALSICDRITVMRKGVKVETVKADDVSLSSLARMMVGREMMLEIRKGASHPGPSLLQVSDLTVRNDFGREAVKRVSFEVRTGEIFGIAGVAGNGQEELVEAIAGLREAQGGEILMNGVSIIHKSPKEIGDLGLAYIPEDRLGRAVISNLSVQDNMILGLQFREKFSEGLIIKPSAIEENARTLIQEFSIMGTKDAPVKSLSGGNIQRVIVAREFSKSPLLILASQPTAGLDIGATEFVRNELLRVRGEQKATLLVSSELEEVLSLSDRIAVMYEGEFMGIKRPEELDEEKVGLMMGGVKIE